MKTHVYTERVKLAAGGQWGSILQAMCGLTEE